MVLLVIVALAAITYGCRIAGAVVAERFPRRGRVRAAFDAIPPAVLTAVIAPVVLATGWRESCAALVTAAAASRLPLLVTIVLGTSTVVLLRAW
jgi:uncharacterized membrane protein